MLNRWLKGKGSKRLVKSYKLHNKTQNVKVLKLYIKVAKGWLKAAKAFGIKSLS